MAKTEGHEFNNRAVVVEGCQDGKDFVVVKLDFEWRPRKYEEERGSGDRFVLSLGEDFGRIPIWLRVESNNDEDDDAEGSDAEEDDDEVTTSHMFNFGYRVNQMPKAVKRIFWKVCHGKKIAEEQPDVVTFQEGTIRRERLDGMLDSVLKDLEGTGGDGLEEVGNVFKTCVPDVLGETLVAAFEIHLEKPGNKALLYKGFQELRSDDCLTDVKLICGGEEFPCHGVVLAAMSPVFKAMLSGKRFKEAKDGLIQIKDFNHDVLQVAIKFLYTHDKDIIGRHAAKLLVFADMYDIQVLRLACETLLTASLSRKNAVAMLKLATETNDEALKTSVNKLIKSNWSSFREDASLKKLLSGDAGLATELLFFFN